MWVTEASETKINKESGSEHRVRDVRTFQRYAAALILPIPPTVVAIARLFQTFVCCAVKIIKTPNDEWDLPPLGLPSGTRS